MKRTILAVSILLAAGLAASAFAADALARDNSRLEGLFDVRGAVDLTSFSAQADVPDVSIPVPIVRVMAEVYVPVVGNMEGVLAARLARLKEKYGFHLDESFPPKLLPDPQVGVLGSAVYLVRGLVPADQIDAMGKDGSVRRVWRDAPVRPAGLPGEEPLKRFLDEHALQILSVHGVRGVAVGVDCPIRKPHQHVRPHQSCLVVFVSGQVPEAAVREELLRRVPELSRTPFRLEADPGRIDPRQMRCMLPEGCS